MLKNKIINIRVARLARFYKMLDKRLKQSYEATRVPYQQSKESPYRRALETLSNCNSENDLKPKTRPRKDKEYFMRMKHALGNEGHI